jgi:hypothetical protein
MTAINSSSTVKNVIAAANDSDQSVTSFAKTLVELGLHEDSTLDDVRFFVDDNKSNLRTILGRNKQEYRELLTQLGEGGPPPADQNVLAARTQSIRGLRRATTHLSVNDGGTKSANETELIGCAGRCLSRADKVRAGEGRLLAVFGCRRR